VCKVSPFPSELRCPGHPKKASAHSVYPWEWFFSTWEIQEKIIYLLHSNTLRHEPLKQRAAPSRFHNTVCFKFTHGTPTDSSDAR
jgi:hypothetical protein